MNSNGSKFFQGFSNNSFVDDVTRSNTKHVLEKKQTNTVFNILDGNSTTHCIDDADDWKCTSKSFLATAPLVIIIVGTYGNIVAYRFLNKKPYKKYIMPSALRYSAILDSFMLWAVSLMIFLRGALEYDFSSANPDACVVTFYGVDFMIGLDAWMLVFITTCRYLEIRFPLKVISWCSKTNYALALLLLHAILITNWGLVCVVYIDIYGRKPMKSTCYDFVATEERNHPIFVLNKVILDYVGPSICLVIINALTHGEISKEDDNTPIRGGKRHSLNSSRNALSSPEALQCPLRKNGELSVNDAAVLTTEMMFTKTSPASNLSEVYTDGQGSPKRCRCQIYDICDTNENAPQKPGASDVDRPKSIYKDPMLDDDNYASTIWTGEPFPTPVPRTRTSRQPVSFDLAFDDDAAEVNSRDGAPRQRALSVAYNKRFSHRSYSLYIGANSITKLLVVSSVVYILINIPYMVFRVSLTDFVMEKVKGCYLRSLIFELAFLLHNSKYLLNFYFYVIKGKQFRKSMNEAMRH